METKEVVSNDQNIYQKLGIKTNSIYFKHWVNGGLLNNIDEDFVSQVQEHWRNNYGKTIDPSLHIAFMNLTGRKDKRMIPGKIMRKEILPIFNDYDMSIFYKDKNLYDILVNPPRSAETVVKNINGTYFDANNNSIDTQTASKKLINSDTDLIIKPSRSNNGNGVVKLNVKGKKIFLDGEVINIYHLEEIYSENFIVQKAIRQHPTMAAPHPSSVNTLRMVTFRWKGEIRYLLAFARFGSNNDIRDNAGVDTGADGIRLGLTETGKFFNVALSKHGQTYTHHPTTGFCFADLDPIPNFEEYKQFVKDCHKNILHLDIISWDVVVGFDGKPIFLEANFAGTTPFYQLAAQRPFFGDLTDEVLQYVSSELKKNKPLLMKKDRDKLEEKVKQRDLDRVKKQKRELKQIQNQNENLKGQYEKLKLALEAREHELKASKDEIIEKEGLLQTKEVELERAKEKYQRIINSKSWRYTHLFRTILKSIKK